MKVTNHLEIPDEELTWRFIRSSGPGGQKVNKTSSCAVLSWAVSRSTAIPQDARDRILTREKRRMSAEGELVLRSQTFRTQSRNREECESRLRDIILASLTAPRKRRPTKPTRASRLRRLVEKKARGSIKQQRKAVEG
jgi:ribosome-associated protein